MRPHFLPSREAHVHLLTKSRKKVQLEEIKADLRLDAGQVVVRADGVPEATGRLARAVRTFFELPTGPHLPVAARSLKKVVGEEPPMALFREKESRLLRLAHKEIVIRFVESVNPRTQRQFLKDRNLEVRATNVFVPNQFVVKLKGEKKSGPALVEFANKLMDDPAVDFATPNFVSEYRRTATAIPLDQWHLKNTAAVAGQKIHEDVSAAQAWEVTQGKPSIVIAVLDDGVDVDHPNLKSNIRKNPDPDQPLDLLGRDFFVPPENHAEHFNPRPKIFQFPFDEMAGNDVHGTPCAGVIAAPGKNGGALGIAPKCRILPVKIFHADAFASDARVANAIRYSARCASILSCSWSGGESPDIASAVEDAGPLGRGGKGSAVFCAAGNEFASPVGFPARHPEAIAVGASTDQGKIADYSNVGKQIWVVAPSSGGKQGIFTSDVAIPNRGFNLGTEAAGGEDGLHTNDFGGTSSATPLAAGVAALVLSVNPNLTRVELKQLLADTADKIGNDHAPTTGHSRRFGFGRVNAAKAVAAAQS
jgi:subtilisin family serine protease